MAQRRMVSVKIIDSAKFIKMPPSTQALYFHLLARADDDGIVEAFNVMRMTGSAEDDLKVLTAKGFVIVLNEDLVSFISDWHEHNLIRADRKIDSIYQNLLLQVVGDVELKKRKQRADRLPKQEPLALNDGNGTSHGQPMDCIGKVSLGKVRSGKVKKDFVPPTVDEVIAYITENAFMVDGKHFHRYYDTSNWIKADGKPVLNWKQTIITWDKKERDKIGQQTPRMQLDMSDNDNVNAMLKGRL